jgi:NADH-quinone oxidoreductase subunit C/D
MSEPVQTNIIDELQAYFNGELLPQETRDGIPTVWSTKDQVHGILSYLKNEADKPYRTLYDLTAIDERERAERQGQPKADFTIVYHLLSYERNADVRIKVAL